MFCGLKMQLMVLKHIITKQQMAEKNHRTSMDKKTGQRSFMKDISHQIPNVAYCCLLNQRSNPLIYQQ
jgi:hypothetical protein